MRIKLEKYIQNIFGLNYTSICLISFPYLIFNWESFSNSSFFNIYKFITLLLVLIISDLILLKTYLKGFKNFHLLLISLYILILFEIHVSKIIDDFQIDVFKKRFIRGRETLIIFSILFILIEFYLFKKVKQWGLIQNLFLVFFSFVLLLSGLFFNQKNKPLIANKLKSDYISFPHKNFRKKPILLFIADEYNSPSGLFKKFHNPKIFNFSSKLHSKGWIVNNTFYTHEIFTIHSLSSLLNFNLSAPKNHYSKALVGFIGSEELLKCRLVDSLKTKNGKVINFGIFDIGEYPPLNRLYYYPKNFMELLISNTIIPTILNNSNNLKSSGFTLSYYPTENHNKLIFQKLLDTLQKTKNENELVFVHLYMPHAPMIYSPEFKLKNNTLNNYLDYWEFTNSKLLPLLNSVAKTNKFRIIFTGDHGLRKQKTIDPHYTFAAFYGFNKEDITKIKSVQDLGSLINGYF